ncbi:MAG: hypothetical protein OXI03_08720, partial [Chloroflexota bacterium]|nr:hypothetical protein [Chloroflexota bacterium]
MVALLTAALLAALPAVVSAQTPDVPPRQYWGSNDTVTIGGEPWDGSEIQVIDEDGNEVAKVQREADGWFVDIPNDVASFRFRASNGAVSELYSPPRGDVQEAFVLTIGSPPGEVATREVALLPEFSFLLWTGQTRSVADALAAFPAASQLSAIFEFDSASGRWRTYRPGRPASLQGIIELRTGVAYVFQVGNAASWEMPADGDLTGARTIVAGITAIGWIGPEATPEDVLDAVANRTAVRALYRFDAARQTYESYRPHVPPIARGSLRTIQPFDVLFIQATLPTTITQEHGSR